MIGRDHLVESAIEIVQPPAEVLQIAPDGERRPRGADEQDADAARTAFDRLAELRHPGRVDGVSALRRSEPQPGDARRVDVQGHPVAAHQSAVSVSWWSWVRRPSLAFQRWVKAASSGRPSLRRVPR